MITSEINSDDLFTKFDILKPIIYLLHNGMLPHHRHHRHKTALLSPQWRLTSKILRTITRMTTTAVNHPIHTWITQALRHGGPPHMSNLGNLIKHYPEYIQPGMEHIAAYIRPPWWEVPAITAISAASKDEAAKAHQQQLRQISTQDLIIYTDGSGHNGNIDAVIYSPTTSIIKGKYIGTDDIYNFYAAELMAIQMAITLFEEKVDEYMNVYVFTDNQSTIQAVDSFGTVYYQRNPGHNRQDPRSQAHLHHPYRMGNRTQECRGK